MRYFRRLRSDHRWEGLAVRWLVVSWAVEDSREARLAAICNFWALSDVQRPRKKRPQTYGFSSHLDSWNYAGLGVSMSYLWTCWVLFLFSHSHVRRISFAHVPPGSKKHTTCPTGGLEDWGILSQSNAPGSHLLSRSRSLGISRKFPI